MWQRGNVTSSRNVTPVPRYPVITFASLPLLVVLLPTLALSVASLTGDDVDGKRWWSYVQALANDQMAGRLPGTAEHRKAAEYVASQFERAGLRPAAGQGYIQPVKF